MRTGLPIAVATATVGLWWLAVVVLAIGPFFLPTPLDVAKAFLAAPQYLLGQAGVTLAETLAGFGCAAVGGVALAIALVASPVVERGVLPLLVVLHSVPKVSLAPLLVVWLGFGPAPKVVLVALICFFPIMLCAAAGLSATPVELGELAASLTATRWRTFIKIRFPWALPQIFTGLKTGITLAVIGAAVAEISAPNSGLGAAIVTSGTNADTPRAFAAIGLLTVISTGLFYGLVGAERLLLRWASETSA